MNVLVVIAFILGYVVIALEQRLNLNKAAPALFTGIICWTIYILSGVDQVNAGNNLLQNLSDISAILFFLIGAMAIVELIGLHKGFDLVNNKIKNKKQSKTAMDYFFHQLFPFRNSEQYDHRHCDNIFNRKITSE